MNPALRAMDAPAAAGTGAAAGAGGLACGIALSVLLAQAQTTRAEHTPPGTSWECWVSLTPRDHGLYCHDPASLDETASLMRVSLYTPPVDMAFVATLAQSVMCHGRGDCTATLIGPAAAGVASLPTGATAFD